MARRMTLADRAPEVGDVLTDGTFTIEAEDTPCYRAFGIVDRYIVRNPAPRRVRPDYSRMWYVSRADGGPVTVKG